MASSNFLQKITFQLKIWQIFIFCEFQFITKVIISYYTIATIFARYSRHEYSLIHKCNYTLTTLSSIANQNANVPLAMLTIFNCQSRKHLNYAYFTLLQSNRFETSSLLKAKQQLQQQEQQQQLQT